MAKVKSRIELCLVDCSPRFVKHGEKRAVNPFTREEIMIAGRRNAHLDDRRPALDAILDRQRSRTSKDGDDTVSFEGAVEVQVGMGSDNDGEDSLVMVVTPAHVNEEVARFLIEVARAMKMILVPFGDESLSAWMKPELGPKEKEKFPDAALVTTPAELIAWIGRIDQEDD